MKQPRLVPKLLVNKKSMKFEHLAMYIWFFQMLFSLAFALT